jgi:hypothetical protein
MLKNSRCGLLVAVLSFPSEFQANDIDILETAASSEIGHFRLRKARDRLFQHNRPIAAVPSPGTVRGSAAFRLASIFAGASSGCHLPVTVGTNTAAPITGPVIEPIKVNNFCTSVMDAFAT